jgi:hypothetical protein
MYTSLLPVLLVYLIGFVGALTFQKKYWVETEPECYLELHGKCMKKVIVLNLDRKPERFELCTLLYKKIKWKIERFSKIDPLYHKTEQHDLNAYHNETAFKAKDWSSAMERDPGDMLDMVRWQTHLQALYHIVEEVASGRIPDQPIMVAEDNLYVSDNDIPYLQRGGRQLPDDWEVFVVGMSNEYCIGVSRRLTSEDAICRARLLMGTNAYIVRNATVAKKLADITNGRDQEPLETFWIPHLVDDLHFYIPRPTELVTHVTSHDYTMHRVAYSPGGGYDS